MYNIQYNSVNKSLTIDNQTFIPGDPVTCTIDGIEIINARLQITYYNYYYICHDNPNFIGSSPVDKLGYKYGWRFSDRSYGERINNLRKTKINIFDNILDKAFNLDNKYE
jgi:hypothetical protein